MKNKLTTFVLVLFVLIILQSVHAEEEQSEETKNSYYIVNEQIAKKDFVYVGMGVVASSTYKDALQESRPGSMISGAGAWIVLEVGFRIRAAKQMYISPKFDVLATSIEFETYPGFPASRKATGVLLPGLGAVYKFSPTKSAMYTGFDVHLVSPFSDLESPALESNGIGYSATLGYSFDDEYDISLYYKHVPVKIGISNDYWNGFEYVTIAGDDSNLGGIGFSFRRLFAI